VRGERDIAEPRYRVGFSSSPSYSFLCLFLLDTLLLPCSFCLGGVCHTHIYDRWNWLTEVLIKDFWAAPGLWCTPFTEYSPAYRYPWWVSGTMNSIRNEIDLIAAFHLAMMVFAALQVHQTRTALCDDSVRRLSLLMTDSLTFCITVV